MDWKWDWEDIAEARGEEIRRLTAALTNYRRVEGEKELTKPPIKHQLPAHRLIIHCLHDAQASCTCGHWYMASTGRRTQAELRHEFNRHLRRI